MRRMVTVGLPVVLGTALAVAFAEEASRRLPTLEAALNEVLGSWSPEDRDATMQFVKTHFEDVRVAIDRQAQKSLEGAKDDPLLLRQVDEMMREAAEDLMNVARSYRDLAQDDPAAARLWLEASKLEMRCEALAEELVAGAQGADVAPTDPRRVELREALARAFELRTKFERNQLERQRKELDETARRLEFREKNRDRIIDGRVDELLKDARLTWE